TITAVCLTALSGLAMAQQETVVFPRESTWKYLDNGSDQGTSWVAPAFDDATWASGAAELGYGDVQTTVVSYGPDSGNKYATTYFRTSFNLAALPASNEDFLLRLKRDDGAIVYINGVEVLRVNMPTGTVTYDQYASATVDGSNETTFFEDVIDPAALQIGTNVIAVEIHQTNPTSSDISFDLELA